MEDDRRHVKPFGQRTTFHPEKSPGHVLANEEPREKRSVSGGKRSATWRVLTDLSVLLLQVLDVDALCAIGKKALPLRFSGQPTWLGLKVKAVSPKAMFPYTPAETHPLWFSGNERCPTGGYRKKGSMGSEGELPRGRRGMLEV